MVGEIKTDTSGIFFLFLSFFLSQFRFLPFFSSFTNYICMISVFFASFCFSCSLNFPRALYSHIQAFRKPNFFFFKKEGSEGSLWFSVFVSCHVEFFF